MQTNPHLTDQQKAVLFDKATEAPFSGSLLYVTDRGKYRCANCNSRLFQSDTKYDAGCGWPSFDKSIDGAITYTRDPSHGIERTEVTCAQCGGHLGHVFDDGPAATTGTRYCINSLSLSFRAKE